MRVEVSYTRVGRIVEDIHTGVATLRPTEGLLCLDFGTNDPDTNKSEVIYPIRQVVKVETFYES
jgi:hypothetical protein